MVQILILFFAILIIPGYLLFSLWKEQSESKFKWLLKVLYTGAYLLFIVLAGRWDWVNYYLRFLLIGLYLVAVYATYQKVKTRPFFVTSGRQRWRSNAGLLLELLVGISLLALTLRGYFYAREPVRLAFPLLDGRYYVGQGGNIFLINYHNPNPAQKFALDIVKINAAGLRAEGIYPQGLDRYEIYGERVHSPCNGRILEAVDGLPDNIPPETDRENLAGNHVEIACENVKVLLAHLKNGSLAVTEGDTVSTGQPLGLVGNSGNTSEPHLHIHAVRGEAPDALEGAGVPILVEGRFPVRNSVFIE